MAETITKLPVKTEEKKAATLGPWRPFENLRREIDRVFDDFGGGMWRSPFGRSLFDVQPLWAARIHMGYSAGRRRRRNRTGLRDYGRIARYGREKRQR